MRRFLLLVFYVLALLLDSVRAFYFSFSMIESRNMLSFYLYVVISFFAISPVLWFSLILDEKKMSSSLRTIVLVKFLSILSVVLFLLEDMKKDQSLPNTESVGTYVIFFLCVDSLMLIFSLVRRMRLCK